MICSKCGAEKVRTELRFLSYEIVCPACGLRLTAYSGMGESVTDFIKRARREWKSKGVAE